MRTRPAQPTRPGTGGARVFDHTADIGLSVWGATLGDLFAWAAVGLARLALDPACLRQAEAAQPEPATQVRQLAVALAPAPDLEALLVAWLNHLIYLLETEGLAVLRSTLEIGTASGAAGPVCGSAGSALPLALRGSATVFPVTAGGVKVAVKAATYHGLKITRQERGGRVTYRARVILDV